ncbi:MAG: MarR family transcriptional regulator [Actinomycetota bacterium]|nr:MarR family transcriptional regulator [Actinomycetota bacterium]
MAGKAPDDRSTEGAVAESADRLVAAARAAAKLARQVTSPLVDLDLSLPQYRVLAVLDEGGTNPSELADRLSVSRPSITAWMEGLSDRGWVERERDPNDGRRVVHHLSDEGRSILTAADAAVGARLERIGRHVNAGDPTPLIDNLGRLGEAIRAARAAGTT